MIGKTQSPSDFKNSNVEVVGGAGHQCHAQMELIHLLSQLKEEEVGSVNPTDYPAYLVCLCDTFCTPVHLARTTHP